MTHKIVVAASVSENGLAILKGAQDVSLQIAAPTLDGILPCLPDANALIVNDDLQVNGQIFDAAPELKVVARAGSSLVNIDLDEATRRGIVVMNTPGVDAVTVAEYTFALMLALVRGVFGAHHDLLDGIWHQDLFVGRQLQGKTLGIIGLGRVGREIASRAIAFGLDVLASDPYVPESSAMDLRLKLVGMDELLRRADIITLHASVVPDTFHLMNAETLAKTKPGVFIVNVKHSSLINQDDLLAALESGQVAGAAVDDFDPDTLTTSPLIGHPKVIHTQRMRFNTIEAQRDLSTLLAPQLLDALRGQDYRNTVNLPFMPGREFEVIAPQLILAEKIGMLQHYLGHRAAIQRVEVDLRGEEMDGLLKPLTVAILRGLLSPQLGGAVNYINAPILARERGIIVAPARGKTIDSYPNLLTCIVKWDDGGELIVAGAIFNRTEPRIVQVDQYRTDFLPVGTLIIMGSFDVPGVIGKVGTYMAEHEINIAGWRTSRVSRGGHTLSVISIDEPLDEERLTELRANDFVRHATQIIF